MTQFPDVAATLDGVLQRLPQISVVKTTHRKLWCEQIVSNAARIGMTNSEVQFTVLRLSGITDSEIGSFVATARGLATPFATPRDIVGTKLLMAPPADPLPDLAREAKALPMMRSLFEDMTPGAELLDGKEFRLGWLRHRDERWMVGSVDDLYRLDGKVGLVRFHVPEPGKAAAIIEGGNVPLAWQCEAHQGCLLAESASGQSIDRIVYAVFDSDQWRMRLLKTPVDRDLAREIITVGRRGWADCVMRGELPEISEKVSIDKQLLGPKAEAAGIDYARYQAIANVAAAKAEAAKASLIAVIGEYGTLGDHKVDYLVSNVTGRKGHDVAGMVARLTELGGKPETCREQQVNVAATIGKLQALGQDAQAALVWVKENLTDLSSTEDRTRAVAMLMSVVEVAAGAAAPSYQAGDYDVSRLQDELRRLDADPSKFEREILTVSLPKQRTGPAAEAVARLREKAAELIERAAHTVATEVVAVKPVEPKRRGAKP